MTNTNDPRPRNENGSLVTEISRESYIDMFYNCSMGIFNELYAEHRRGLETSDN